MHKLTIHVEDVLIASDGEEHAVQVTIITVELYKM